MTTTKDLTRSVQHAPTQGKAHTLATFGFACAFILALVVLSVALS